MSPALPTRGLRFTVGDQPIPSGAYVSIGPHDGKVYPWSGARDHGTAGDYLRPGEQVEVDHRGLLVPVAASGVTPGAVYIGQPTARYEWRCTCGATGIDATPSDSSLSFGIHMNCRHGVVN